MYRVCSCSWNWSSRRSRRSRRTRRSLWRWRATCAGPSWRQTERNEPLKNQQGCLGLADCACDCGRRDVRRCLYERARESVFGLAVVRDKLPGFSTLSCSSLQWGERLYILKTAPSACLPQGLPVHTSAPHNHSAAHSTPCRRDLARSCYVAFQRASSELWWRNKQTHMQEFSSPLFSLTSPQQALVFLHPLQCCYCRLCCSCLYNQLSKSGHWIDSWSCVM